MRFLDTLYQDKVSISSSALFLKKGKNAQNDNHNTQNTIENSGAISTKGFYEKASSSAIKEEVPIYNAAND